MSVGGINYEPISRCAASGCAATLGARAFAVCYYTFLRLVVTGWALFIVWAEYQRVGGVNGWTVAFALVAALFNPIVPVYLDRETWAVLDIGGAAIFGA